MHGKPYFPSGIPVGSQELVRFWLQTGLYLEVPARGLQPDTGHCQAAGTKPGCVPSGSSSLELGPRLPSIATQHGKRGRNAEYQEN